MTLQQAEARLTKAYLWRQRRYARDANGSRRGGGNAFNEENMAREITALENAVEDLGGDPRRCLLLARGEAQRCVKCRASLTEETP